MFPPERPPGPENSTFWCFWPVSGPERGCKISLRRPGTLKPVNRKLQPQEAEPLEVAVVRKLRNANAVPMSQKKSRKHPTGAELRPKKGSSGGWGNGVNRLGPIGSQLGDPYPIPVCRCQRTTGGHRCPCGRCRRSSASPASPGPWSSPCRPVPAPFTSRSATCPLRGSSPSSDPASSLGPRRWGSPPLTWVCPFSSMPGGSPNRSQPYSRFGIWTELKGVWPKTPVFGDFQPVGVRSAKTETVKKPAEFRGENFWAAGFSLPKVPLAPGNCVFLFSVGVRGLKRAQNPPQHRCRPVGVRPERKVGPEKVAETHPG